MLYKELSIGGKDYKCVLNAMSAIKAEDMLGENPLNSLMEVSQGNKAPNLKVILTIFWASLQKYQPEIDFEQAAELYDEYVSEGDHQMSDFISEIVDIFTVSGFFKTGKVEKNAQKRVKK